MMKNKYKKYYDKVLPDPKLVEETKEKMLEELLRDDVSKKPSISVLNKYMAVAACVALTAAALLLVPDLKDRVPVTDSQPCQTQTEPQSCSRSQTDKTQTDRKATEKKESTTYHNNTSSQGSKNSESIVTAVPSDQKNTLKPTNADTLSNKQTDHIDRQTAAVINNSGNAAPQKTDKEPQVQTEVASQIQTETPTVRETNAVTTHTGIKPGGANPDATIAVTSVEQAQPKPQYSVITVGESTINLNDSYFDDNIIFNESNQISLTQANDYFGTEIIPQSLKDVSSDIVGTVNKYDPGYTSGIGFIFGTESSFDKKNSPFIAMSVSKSEPVSGYQFICGNPVYTEINGCSYNIGKSLDYAIDIYYCKFNKNGIYYNLCFKEYSIEDVMRIILSF